MRKKLTQTTKIYFNRTFGILEL